LTGLLNGRETEVRMFGFQVILDPLRQVPHDTDDLVHTGLFEQVQHVVEHGSVADPEQWLGRGVCVRTEACPFSGQRKYGLHGALTGVQMEGARTAGTYGAAPDPATEIGCLEPGFLRHPAARKTVARRT
jgi:hypothetical protein